jgi:hypothetical protein
MPTWRSVAGQFGVSFGPKDSVSSWAQVSRWFTQLTADRREGTRDHSVHLRQGSRDCGWRYRSNGDRRLTAYVQHGIRYVAIEIGVGGYRPHAAQEVLASGYGDCKEKVTQLNAMLREAAIDSYYVLINIDRDYVGTKFPSPLGFNHVILAIRRATLSCQGRLRFFHMKNWERCFSLTPPTALLALDSLPASLQSNHGLLVADAEGELVDLPLSPPSANRLLRVATLSPDKLGKLERQH